MLTIVEAEELTISKIEFWLDRLYLRNAAPKKVKLKLGAR
jgi:hypothetical protein